ncbi:MAG: alpha/beta hydrolase [Opitutales bacterium]
MRAPLDLSARLARLLARMQAGEDSVRRELLGEVDCPDSLARREVTVYLPAGYRRGDDVPLLLALDGQNMPRWRLPEAMTQLAALPGAPVPLVVAVPASAARREEYGVAGVPDYAGRGRLAGVFQEYLTRSVLPAVRSRYGAGLSPERTGIFGASLGGLCAFDTAWRHPWHFGLAGVFSGSFWWRTDDSSPAAQQASRIAHRCVRDTATKPPLRFWLQAGTEDETADRDSNGVIDTIQDTTELVDELTARGYERGREVFYRETAGGRHDEATWADEVPGFLRWAWPGAGK